MTREYLKTHRNVSEHPQKRLKKTTPTKAQKRVERSQDRIADASGTRTHAQSARINKVMATKQQKTSAQLDRIADASGTCTHVQSA